MEKELKYSKTYVSKLPVNELLRLIYENQIHETSIVHMSKEKLSDFVLEVFNKGIISNYLGLK